MVNSLAIVGAGRVGRALGKRLREQGWRIGAVVARSEGGARRAVRFIGGGRACAGVSSDVLAARVVLLATPDDEIISVARRLAELLRQSGERKAHATVFLHTSGALDASILEALRKEGAAVGSMHPLQTFSGVGVPVLEGKYFAMEGDPAAVRVARSMVRCFGGRAVRISARKKRLYHAAAALATGHVLAVEEAATRMLMSAGMKRHEAVRALLSLTRQVLENFERLGAHAAWTGPLARGDYRVIVAHEEAMSGLPPEYMCAYEALNRLGARVLANDAAGALAQLDNIVVTEQTTGKSRRTERD
ncbi:MAG: DUF2520 domain-containing protein [Candidatus Acidiferrum sp.]|jgi:predicted short-subunit dehydrogenase-like oxidoreductase (DUF2520 family)